MPKTSQRLFENLLRAFGVIGAGGGDELRFPLTGSVTPIVDADAYDPSPIFGFNTTSPLVAGQFSWVEVRANPWARLICYNRSALCTIRRVSDFDPAGVAPAADPLGFTSSGERPRAELRIGSTAAPLGGVLIGTNATLFPLVVPIHWQGVIRIESIFVASLFAVDLFFQEQRAV